VLSTVLTVGRESFLLMKRDKIFFPALAGSILVALFANLASDWSIAEFEKILFDIGGVGFQITGSLVAIFWGTKTIQDSRTEGSLEVQLATPLNRSSWLIGKYLGLVTALVFLMAIMLMLWQVLMLLNAFGWMTANQVAIFSLLALSWLVLGAMSIFLASFCGQSVALFGALSLWFGGMAASLVNNSLAPETSEVTKSIVGNVARIWDLQRFNLIDFATNGNILTKQEIISHAAYGTTLIAFFIVASTIIFTRRDLI
jgi:Cu-processing system permease protein